MGMFIPGKRAGRTMPTPAIALQAAHGRLKNDPGWLEGPARHPAGPLCSWTMWAASRHGMAAICAKNEKTTAAPGPAS